MAEITWDDEQSKKSPLAPQPKPGPLSQMILGQPVQGEQERTGLTRTLLGPGGQAARERGAVTLPAMLTRVLGGSEGTAEAIGKGGQSLQRSLAMPWSRATGAAGLLKRAVQGAGLGAAEGVTEGDIGKRALTGAAASLGGDIVGKGIRRAGSVVSHKLYSQKSGKAVTDWLAQNIPAWKGMTGQRALYEMAREGGQGKLQDAYAKALLAAQNAIPEGTTVNIAADSAKRAGFKLKDVAVDRFGDVAVDAREMMKRIPDLTKDQTTRRAVMDALTEGLPPGAIPEDAMRAYRMGSGWMDFAKKSGLFKQGEQYSAATAQRGLREVGKETLESRGMGRVRDIIRGPLAQPPIRRSSASNPLAILGALLGASGGGTGFGPMGGIAGAGGGAFLGGQIGRKLPIYKNVPETLPQIGQLRRALIQALSQRVVSS